MNQLEWFWPLMRTRSRICAKEPVSKIDPSVTIAVILSQTNIFLITPGKMILLAYPWLLKHCSNSVGSWPELHKLGGISTWLCTQDNIKHCLPFGAGASSSDSSEESSELGGFLEGTGFLTGWGVLISGFFATAKDKTSVSLDISISKKCHKITSNWFQWFDQILQI